MTGLVRGGVKFYRGSPAGARAYVEADHARADDYYLAEGSGVAEHYVARPRDGSFVVDRLPDLDGPTYERWVHGYDVASGLAKGRISNADNALRFVEVVINGPKTWSIAAALHPEIAAAYDAAQDRAAGEIIGWLAEHSTTRVGPRGRQVQISIESGLEAAVIRHYTSRTGDPHRHLHLQINAKVFAAGTWRALHSVGTRDSIEAINGIGHAAVMCDPDFRAALAGLGYTVRDDGEIGELVPYAGRFSQRTAQIGRNLDRYETQWRREHPGQEPGPKLRRSWDRRAWADARPDKIIPTNGQDLIEHWTDELRDLGFTPPTAPATAVGTRIAAIDRDVLADTILVRLGARHSAWNAADIRGEAEKLIAASGVIAERGVRTELVEDIAGRAMAACTPLLDRNDVPEHVRALTSKGVPAVEASLQDTFATRGAGQVWSNHRLRHLEHLDPGQAEVVRALAGRAGLLVIEGAAGTGKTTTLAAAQTALEAQSRRLVVVTPTLKAAQAARGQVGTDAFSAAWLIHQHGYRWDQDGRWTQVPPSPQGIERQARLYPDDVLLVDEAGMLDQDTAVALMTIADQSGATVALLGDRHQLPAVGRGGVLDHAARYVQPEAHLELESVRRFADPSYANLTLKMRTGEDPRAVFDQLLARGEVVIHPSDVERAATVAVLGATSAGLVIADTREQVTALNAAISDLRRTPGVGEGDMVTDGGERIVLGDRVATRRNDRNLGVANRDTWTVIGIGADHSLMLQGRVGQRQVPAEYARQHVELAFATTVYGAQGDTVDTAHLIIGDTTGAAAAYVGMTRGRHHNVAHMVAATVEEARDQWTDVFRRDRADLGPAHSATRATEDIDLYGPQIAQTLLDQAAARRLRPEEMPPSMEPPGGPGYGR